MKIALAQTQAHIGNIKANIQDHIAMINIAVNHECQAIIFPELSITGYQPSLANQLALHISNERLIIFQTLADQHDINILVGAPIKSKGKPNIGLMIFQPNQAPYAHYKFHLHDSEIEYFSSKSNQTIHLRNYPEIALAICYESSFEPLWQQAQIEGAKIFIASVANDAPGIERAHIRFKKWVKKFKLTALMVNMTGQQQAFNAIGETSIYTPDKGQILKQNNQPSLTIYDHQTQQIKTHTISEYPHL